VVLAGAGLLAEACPVRAADAAGQRYALVIGVNRYLNRDAMKQPDLRFADADAGGIADALQAAGYAPGNVILLTTKGEQGDRLYATGAHIRKELRTLLRDRTPADTVLVAF